MAKGTYTIKEDENVSPSDSSFKSCTCALLIFLALCVIILLASIRWTKNEIKNQVKEEIEMIKVEDNHAEHKANEKMVASTTLGTTTTVTNVTNSSAIIAKINELLETTTINIENKLNSTEFARTSSYNTLKLSINNGSTLFNQSEEVLDAKITSTTTKPTSSSTLSDLVSTLSKSIPFYVNSSQTSTHASVKKVNFPTTPYLDNESSERILNANFTSELSTESGTFSSEISILDNSSAQSVPNNVLTNFETSTQATERNLTTIPYVNVTTNYTTSAKSVENGRSSTSSTTQRVSTEESPDWVVGEFDFSSLNTEQTDNSEGSSVSTQYKNYSSSKPTEPTLIAQTATTLASNQTYITTSSQSSNQDEGNLHFFNGTTTGGLQIIKRNHQQTNISIKNNERSITAVTEHDVYSATAASTFPAASDTEIFNKTNESKFEKLVMTTENFPKSTKRPPISDGQQQAIVDYDFSSEEDTNGTSSVIKLNAVETTNNKSQLLHELQKLEPVCSAVECKSATSRMLSLMKFSVDPCEDFYEFSCGGMQVDKDKQDDVWKDISQQVNLINESSPSYLKTFRTFYDSCVEHEYVFDYEERVAEVLKLVKEVGEIYEHNESQPEIDMTSLFGKLILRQSHPSINVDVDIDKQSSKFILKLVLPEKTSLLSESGRWSALSESQTRCLVRERDELQKHKLNLTKIHSSYLECKKDQEIYLNSVQAVVRTLGFYSHLEHQYNKSQQILELRTTIEWDILDYLLALPPPNVVRKAQLSKNYVVFKISDLQLNYGFLNWNTLFTILTGHDLNNDTEVQVYFPEYFANMFGKLHQSSNRKINNALIAMYAHDLYEHLVLPQAKHSREDYCLKLSSKLFNDVTNNLYFKTWTNEKMISSQKFTLKIFNKLKDRMEMAFKNVTWLDTASHISSLTKLKKMTLGFNEVDDFYNKDDYLSLRYSHIGLNRTNWFHNSITMIEARKRKQFSLQGERFSIDYLWGNFLAAYDVKPTSFYSKYFIMVPLGMLKQPIEKIPGYVTMARIGLSLAREIGRHFDPVGVENGMTLSPKSTFPYKTMIRTINNGYLSSWSKFLRNYNISFNGDAELSTNERIADNTALKLITDSFNSIGDDSLLPWISTTFSKRKIFFITVAQEYCKQTTMAEFTQAVLESEILPSTLRVENLVTNSIEFSDAFECPEGSPMNDNPYRVQFPYLQDVREL